MKGDITQKNCGNAEPLRSNILIIAFQLSYFSNA